MPLLTRKKVLAVDRNLTFTLPTTLSTAATAQNIPLDPIASLDVERIERNFPTTTITAVKDLAGQKAVEFTFGCELRGSNNGTGEPQWAKLLDGCGFNGVAVDKISIGAVTGGPFRHLETITGSTSGETATVVMDTHNGADVIYFANQTGAFGAETLTGSDTGATAVSSGSPSDAGYGYWPVSLVEKRISVSAVSTNMVEGDLLEGATSGARGVLSRDLGTSDSVMYYRAIRGSWSAGETLNNVTVGSGTVTAGSPTNESYQQAGPLGMRLFTDGKSVTGNACRGNVVFNFEVNRPVTMNFTFRGVLADTTDRPLIEGIDYENVDPPLWESSSIGYAQNEDGTDTDVADEVQPCITTLSLDMGNNIADRKCAGAASGLVEVFNAARDGSGSMSVEDTLESDIGWLTRIEDNKVVRLNLTVGSTAGNKFTFSMPGIQFTEQSEGDTDGIVTQDMTFRLTGGNLYNLNGSPADPLLTAIGGDNEVVFIYHTS